MKQPDTGDIWMKLLNWQTKRELMTGPPDRRTSGPTDLQMAKDLRMEEDLKLGRPSRLEENDQEESKLAKSNHFLPRKLLIDGNKSLFCCICEQ